ncbi:omptin family outer membrane protease [Xenorhabdus sp. Sc-CR9]|uniref:omptin family outer membrane protease n=1 Tax=Xenorhabdus sp. Sc-CR9 TaxID=2584468 RepID=UPI001F248146|nr:omptin family outer membrane protease [Xenorhabdus sp. Sc-CR9]
MRKVLMAFTLTALSFGTAAESSSEPKLNLDSGNVFFDIDFGWLRGESKEYVYDVETGRKMSELDWKIGNALIAKGSISWDTFYWLTLNANGWVKLTSRNSKSDDYNYNLNNSKKQSQSEWIDKSVSPNTPLNYANEFDLNAITWLIKQPDYKLGALLGYQETRFSWTDYDGYYSYDGGKDKGSFSSTAGIGYQQKYSLPYIGLRGQYRYQDLEFNILLKFSPWVKAKDHDEHYLSNQTFYEQSDSVRYYGVAIDAGYYVTPEIKVYTAFVWNKYHEGKGNTVMHNNKTDKTNYSDDGSSGIENRNYNMNFGVQYCF